jgi:membrane protein YqaA with SNARE-associated domain
MKIMKEILYFFLFFMAFMVNLILSVEEESVAFPSSDNADMRHMQLIVS